MKILTSIPLAKYTSLRVGGPAEHLMLCESYTDIHRALQDFPKSHVLGYGCNILVSDDGLSGTTLLFQGGSTTIEDTLVIADAGVWWDDVVKMAIDHGLWGLELMSAVPSSVGGAVFGNIACYGQQISDTLAWIDIFDTETGEISRQPKESFVFGYRESSLQKDNSKIIVRAAFQLSRKPLHELKYDSAIAIGKELGIDHTTLEHCRNIIIETRRRAGSLYDPHDPDPERTAGSFFKNPMVSKEQAEMLARFDETGKTLERILSQAKIHGGTTQRASAAHILLAAGYHRGQTWDKVRLHPSHVLKLSTLPGATAQEVYDVCQEIIATVKNNLDIDLEPEVKFIGTFRQ